MYKTINGWTKQRMIEVIRKNNDGTRAFDSIEGDCMYLTTDGNRCAVGCFIPDKYLAGAYHGRGEDPFMSTGSASDLLEKFPSLKKSMPLTAKALDKMQLAHDFYSGRGDVRNVLARWIEKNVVDRDNPGISSPTTI